MNTNDSAAAAAQVENQNTDIGVFDDWGPDNDRTNNQTNENNEDDQQQDQQQQQQESSNETSTSTEAETFDAEKFQSEYKKKNPNATEEEISEAIKSEEDKFFSVSADIFDDGKQKIEEKTNVKLVESLKSIAGEDFDEVAHSVVNTPEEFNQALQEIVNKRVDKAKEEAVKVNEFVETMSETDKALFNVLQEKGLQGVSEFLNPGSRFQELKAMDDESLVIQGLRSSVDAEGKRVYTDEDISEKVSRMEEEDLARDAKGIRAELDKLIMQRRNQMAETINNDKRLREQRSQVEKDQMSEKIKIAASRLTDFHGLKLEPNLSETIAMKFKNGDFDYYLKDPNFWVKSILFDKLGSKAFAKVGKDQYERGRENKSRVDHNASLPDNAIGGGSQGTSNSSGSGLDW